MKAVLTARALLSVILLLAGGLIVTAMRRQSTTFDEIVMIAAGARGYQTGEFNLAPEHPPFTQYLYGLLPHLAGANLPDETGVTENQMRHMGYRYRYAQFFFFQAGNDPETMAFLGRLPSALCAVLLALLAFVFVRRGYGDRAALIAAALVAFTPDVLAHGGIAYNDMPIALMYLLALWLADRAIRVPAGRNALLAGLALGLALGTKNSAVALGPALLLLLGAEALVRRGQRDWLKRIVPAALLTCAAAYLALVLIYRGDFLLTEYRYALKFVSVQVSSTLAPAYLLGEIRREGFPLYFPIAFLYKTSLGFHALLALTAWYFAARFAHTPPTPAPSPSRLSSPLRVPLIGALVFAALLMRSQLHIGFRYALPILPLIAIVVAVGTARILETNWKRLRLAAALALAWAIIHPISYYPNFLTYVSEYGPGRRANYRVFADSSLDWGQGLLQLRDYMREHNIPSVYLSYFGSAWPGAYGISYVPLYSFFELPPLAQPPAEPPRYAAISATNLTGTYFNGDPFRQFREQRPIAVLGNSILVYRLSN